MNYLELVNKVDQLNDHYKDTDSFTLLRDLALEFPSLTLVSSFGAESAVLLHLVSRVNINIPVVLIDTGKLFEETLQYKDILKHEFGLKNIKSFKPDTSMLNAKDPHGIAHESRPDLCCFIRKVEPLNRALKNTNIWISGRKKYQSASRSNIPLFELDDMRIKVNPLANWSRDDMAYYIEKYKLPEHPLLKDNFLSIGCMPCTTAVGKDEDPRAGRWRGQVKTECGIHGNTL
ncbi:phosphoadenylyl-sulfate reductase [Pseudemcibacter aquimaris]|uniref:phosphoadenylyl-sulfate reductase n=1 Tax=Pseudemcibacter aquimaris TaxID=2857064 RepID=UPI0020115FE9|nr:phosphoadenylyl-sulfate reductase [Pseudemcibacter aquimaris]MCC3861198.1 phosphoadenylyl-sulfate reductase [Pseudemcibacter aquimaris]WDU57973.1 phosphoadenylyl-sulfate reductase [Pseudemcibacter aquimaris]